MPVRQKIKQKKTRRKNHSPMLLVVSCLLLVLLVGFGFWQIYLEQKQAILPAQAQTESAIAIRVLKNQEHLSPEQWYKENVPHPGNPQSTVIDGYQAIRDGRSIYVSAANLGDDNQLHSNIYLISYSEGAGATAQKIFEQLLANWQFNSNISPNNAGKVCSSDYTTVCDEDKDCPKNETCLNIEPKPRLTRDVKRLADLQNVRQELEDYNYQAGSYPTLSSGTYIPKLSFSVWPSWQKTLGQNLSSTLPPDPINRFMGCTNPYDPTTCWDNKALAFSCPLNYFIYAYQSPTLSGDQAKLYTKLEYNDQNWASTLDILTNPQELLGYNCQLNFGQNTNDYDNDTVPNGDDNCPTIPNTTQTDTDNDKIGDACDACPNDIQNDQDNDGYCVGLASLVFGNKKSNDNCPTIYNPSQQPNPDNPSVGLACSRCQDIDLDSFCSFETAGDDCDDNNRAIHPGAPELPNGLDDNCNGKIDECEASLNIRVYQGTTINKVSPAFSLAEDAVQFYNNFTDFDYNSDGLTDFLGARLSNLFIYHNQTNNRLYLGFVHNEANCGACPRGKALFNLSGLPSDAQFVKKDDNDQPTDTYSLEKVTWTWTIGHDGAMIDLGPATRGWEIIITPTNWQNVDTWRVAFDNLGVAVDYVDLDMSKAVTLEYDPKSKVIKPIPCYSGPAGTEGVGICKGGQAVCQKVGVWGTCQGQVVPQPERCDSELVDSDCDGDPNNGCDVDGDGWCAPDSGCTEPYGTLGDGCPQGCCDFDDNDPTLPENCTMIKGKCICEITHYKDIPEWGEGIGINIIPNQDWLEVNPIYTPYVWVASSGNNSVYSINADNNTMAGPFAVGVNPSRTAVDIDNRVWVGNRDSANVTHLDVNGNVLDTCAVGTGPRAVAIDRDGSVWIGNYNDGTVYKLDNLDSDGDGNRCEILENINVGGNPYGGAIDGLGNLWISNRFIDDPATPENEGLTKSSVIKINTQTNQVECSTTSLTGYGIAIDKNNKVWSALWEGQAVVRIGQSCQIERTTNFSTNARAIAVDKDNNVWVTHTLTDRVTKLDNNGNVLFSRCTDPTLDCNITLGASPIGITATTDINGNSYMWVVNYTTARASKFDFNGNLLTSVNVGVTPYTYSDMAGYMLRAITFGGGSWTVKVDSHIDNPIWKTLSWDEVEPGDSYARIRVRSADTEAELNADPDGAIIAWSNYYNTSPANITLIPKKRWLQIQVDLHLSFNDQSPTVDNLKVDLSFWN